MPVIIFKSCQNISIGQSNFTLEKVKSINSKYKLAIRILFHTKILFQNFKVLKNRNITAIGTSFGYNATTIIENSYFFDNQGTCIDLTEDNSNELYITNSTFKYNNSTM